MTPSAETETPLAEDSVSGDPVSVDDDSVDDVSTDDDSTDDVSTDDDSTDDDSTDDVWLDTDHSADREVSEVSEAADDRRRRAAAQKCHLQYLAMSLVVLVLAFILTTPDNERVDIPGGWTVPELCAVKAWFGTTCPGCGLTRSFVHAFDGRWNEAFAMHPVGPLFVCVVIAQVPYRIWRVRSIGLGRSIESPRWTAWFGRALITALIGQWILRMCIEPTAQ